MDGLAAFASNRKLFDRLDADASNALEPDELLGSPEFLALIAREGEDGDAAALSRPAVTCR